ncbi:MAG: carboxypeptidase regulatory-like domain-containing protein, partial [Planctomycetota bacterium JB042]
VCSSDLFGDPTAWELGVVKGATRTDEEGRFRFTGVDPGALHALVIDGGGARADLRILDATPNSGEERDVGDIVMQAFVTFTGKVEDLGGEPVAGARVRATNIPPIVFQFGAADVDPDGGVLYDAPGKTGRKWGVFRFPAAARTLLERLPVPSTETLEDGTFVLEGVPIGVVTVLVDEPGFVTLVHGPVPTGGGGERSIGTLTLDAGDELGGVVLDGAGAPVPGAEVLVGPKFELTDDAALLRPGDVAGSDGRFHVVGVSDEDQFVAVRKPGGVDWVVLEDVSPGATDLEVRFPAEHSLRVLAVDANGGTIERPALVLNEIGEEEAIVAAVLVGPRPLAKRTTYDEAGAAVVEGLGRSRYRVLVRADGYAAKDVDADLREGPADVRVELEPARTVRVRALRGVDGSPVEYALVQAFEFDDEVDIEGLPFASGRTDPDGRVALTGVPAKGCNLRVSHPAYAIADLPGVAADIEVDVPLLAGGSIRGRVHAGGEPLDAPRFLGLGPDDNVVMPRMATTDLDGEFEFTRLAPGEYELVVLPRFANERGVVDLFQDMFLSFGMPERQVDVVVVEGRETVLDIDVLGVDGDLRTALLSGRVLIDGRPGVGASVTAMPQGAWEGRKSTRTDGDGRFEFGQVAIGPTGKVALSVAPAGVRNDNWWMGGFYHRTLHLPENSTRVLMVDIRTGRLSGRVVRDDDGRAIPQAQVIVRSAHRPPGSQFMIDGSEPSEPPPQSEEPAPASAQVVQTDPDGRFEIDMLPEGTYVVQAEADGFAEATVASIRVPIGGAPPPVTIRMVGALMVAGRIVLPPDAPEGNRWLQFESRIEGNERTRWTGVDEGKFETDELSPGEWDVMLNIWGDPDGPRQYKGTLVVPKEGLADAVVHLTAVESSE